LAVGFLRRKNIWQGKGSTKSNRLETNILLLLLHDMNLG